MASKRKNASKRYKGAAIVDSELQNILQKHAKEERRREVMHAGDDLHSVRRALAEEKRKQAEILEGEEDWQSLRRKLREQKRKQHEAQYFDEEGFSLNIVFTTCGAVLALIIMAMSLLLWGR